MTKSAITSERGSIEGIDETFNGGHCDRNNRSLKRCSSSTFSCSESSSGSSGTSESENLANSEDAQTSSTKQDGVCQTATNAAQLSTVERKLEILDCIAHAQRMFLQNEPINEVFQCLLQHLLQLQESEFAFIGKVEFNEDQEMFLNVYVRASSEEKEKEFKFTEFVSPHAIRFYNVHNLFGNCILHKEPVISNDYLHDKRSRGATPPGHPEMRNFLGIPFFNKNETIGMVGLANRNGGYSQADVELLEPFLGTCSSMIQAYAQVKENERLINTLEEKVKERTQKLQSANEKLESANRRVVEASQAQLQHFACMSHEIRTPLNCIIGLSSLLSESEMTPMQNESFRMITSSSEILSTVIDDVLDYSKLETGNVEIAIHRCSLQDTLNAILHSMQTKADKKQLQLCTDYDPRVPEYVETDSQRLSQILFNLLGNATKFSKEGGNIDLAVRLCSTNDISVEGEFFPEYTGKAVQGRFSRLVADMSDTPAMCTGDDFAPAGFIDADTVIQFAVTDYGQGIDPKDFAKIFRPFQQASIETERVYGGTGLGLPISAKLAHGLGGTISVCSEPGKFARFTVSLPLVGNAVPLEQLSQSLSSTTLLFVGKRTEQRQLMKYLEELSVDICMMNTCGDLEDLMRRPRFFKQNRSYIFLCDECCFKENTYNLLLRKTRNAALLTFGPDFQVAQSYDHFRSFGQVLPSVLFQIISKALCAARSSPGGLSPKPRRPVKCAEYLGYRVLAAEDNKINRKVLSGLLTKIGIHDVDIVTNGKEAVEAEVAREYDVVLMDLQMPVMDGIEATKAIIERPHREHALPFIIFVTAHCAASFQADCDKAGGAGFLSKPFKLQDLENLFEKVYEEREMQHMRALDAAPLFEQGGNIDSLQPGGSF